MVTQPLSRDSFEDLFSDPSRGAFEQFLHSHFGEGAEIDFKAEWIEWPKVAKTVLAIANSGGGLIVLGVSEDNANGSVQPIGLSRLMDSADFDNGIRRFLPPKLTEEIRLASLDYTNAANGNLASMLFNLIVIPDMPRYLPFVAERDGEGISRTHIYVRHMAKNEVATYHDIQTLLNRRLEQGFPSTREFVLQEHFDQLKLLYDLSPKTIGGGYVPSAFYQVVDSISKSMNLSMGTKYVEPEENPYHPRESYMAFVGRMISAKKKVIERELGVDGLTTHPS